MEKKKLKVSLLSILLLVSIIVIVVMGYYIYRLSGEKKLDTQEISNLKTKVSQVEEKSNTLQNTIENIKNTVTSTAPSETKKTESTEEDTATKNNYDGSKEIIINEKKHTVSYIIDKLGKEKEYIDGIKSSKSTEIQIFCNDRKVKTVDLEEGAYNIELDLKNINKEYIVAIVKNSSGYFDFARLCIMKNDGTYVDTLNWSNIQGYYNLKTKKSCNYEVNDDNIIMYEKGEGLEKVKYTIKNSELIREVIEIYDWNDIEVSGK